MSGFEVTGAHHVPAELHIIIHLVIASRRVDSRVVGLRVYGRLLDLLLLEDSHVWSESL